MKKIEISTLQVSVNILMLDNKRFTKSIYKQLPTHRIEFNSFKEFFKETDIRKILGFVQDDSQTGYSMLVVDDSILERWIYPYQYWNDDMIDFRVVAAKFSQIFISC